MEFAYFLHGGAAPLAMKFQVTETLANAGIPVLSAGTRNDGVQISSTGGWANAAGVTLDTATFVTAQQTVGSAERQVSVIISPQAVFKAKMSGGASEDTALTLFDVTTAVADGKTVTTGDTWTSTEYVDGVAWGYDGANIGQKRRIDTSSATGATFVVPFDNATIVGDNFLRAPWWFLADEGDQITTTTLLTQARADIAVGSGGVAKIIDMELNDVGGDGRNTSSVLFIFDDHVLRENT